MKKCYTSNVMDLLDPYFSKAKMKLINLENIFIISFWYLDSHLFWILTYFYQN